VLYQTKDGGGMGDQTHAPLGPFLKQNFAEVKAFCRVVNTGTATGIVTYSGKDSSTYLRSFREKNITYSDTDFFKLFSFKVLQGKPNLSQPNQVVISQSQAKKYFGLERAIGNLLTLHNQFGKTTYTVSAIFEDIPQNSDFQADMIFSLQTLANPANLGNNSWAKLDEWSGSFLQSLILLDKQTDFSALEQKINVFKNKTMPDAADISVHLQALQYLHLGKSLGDKYPTTSNLTFMYLLACIGGLILVIAWLNYINLSTASSLKRAKEVGIRKVAGASRWQLIGQFLGESMLLNSMGFIFALLLIELFQGGFNQLINKDLSVFSLFKNSAWLVGLSLIVGGFILSGGYVAYLLSSFPTVDTLKGTFIRSLKGVFLRKTLVVFQFTISITLIIATMILHRQLQFMQNQNLGMNIEQLLVIRGPQVIKAEKTKQSYMAFKHTLSQLPYIQHYCMSGSVPGNWYNFSFSPLTKLNPVAGDEKKVYQATLFDDKFLKTYQIPLAAGSNFTPEMCEKAFEGDKIMLNEKAVKQIGFRSNQEAVNHKVKWGDKEFKIVGIVKDYHHQSLKQAIEPLVVIPQYNTGNYTIRLNSKDIQKKVSELEAIYKKNFPGNPFEFYFVDENFDKQYQAEQQYGFIFIIASSLAIFIASLGLFGLATFSVEQKTKEIGIRKVMGASVQSIVWLLTRDFVRLILAAFLIASPIAYYAMTYWLQDFAYRTDINWYIFALAGIFALLVAVITIASQAIRASLINPVESLKYE
jgi:putative ABC transport system permease protein